MTIVNKKYLIELAAKNELRGFFPNLPERLYHEAPAFSAGTIARIEKYSLALVRAQHGKQLPATPEMELGSAVHMALLEPERFKKEVTHVPEEFHGRSFAAIESRALFMKANANKIVLEDGKKFDSVKEMVDAVQQFLSVSEVPDLLNDGESEVSCFHRDQETGLLLKCRADKLHRDLGIAVNFKTSKSVEYRDFQGSVMDFFYHLSSAWYVDILSAELGMQVNELHLIVEPKPPYNVSLRYFDEGSLDKGREIYRKNLRDIAECEKTGKWPAMQPMALPHWAF